VSRHADDATRDRLFDQLAADPSTDDQETMIALTWGFLAPLWLRDEPLEIRVSHVDSPHAAFRRVVAGCPDLPDDLWARLDDDPDVAVRRAAARRPTAPADVLERLLREHGDIFWEQPMLVDHPNLPRDRVRTFADAADPQVRQLALHDPMLPTPTLAGMAGDPRVRCGVAGHPNLDEALFEQVLTDPEPSVVHAAAANPALPRHRMERLLTDQSL
jgi:hypothetical protein